MYSLLGYSLYTACIVWKGYSPFNFNIYRLFIFRIKGCVFIAVNLVLQNLEDSTHMCLFKKYPKILSNGDFVNLPLN